MRLPVVALVEGDLVNDVGRGKRVPREFSEHEELRPLPELVAANASPSPAVLVLKAFSVFCVLLIDKMQGMPNAVSSSTFTTP